MSTALTDHLSAGGPGVRLWLKSAAYCRRLLAGADDPHVAAAGYLAFFAQAQGLLRPDVAVIEVADLYRSWRERHADVVAGWAGRRRAALPLRRMLDEDEPRRLLAEVTTAVVSHLGGRTPLVLALPAPRVWLDEVKAAAGLGDVAADADAVEDAAMYMADLLRSVSGEAIAGVLFEAGSDEIGTGDLAPFRPLLNVAAHYRWATAIRGRFAAEVPAGALAEFDVVISDRPVDGAKLFGRDVGAEVWGGGAVPLGSAAFAFVEVPVAAEPETVLDALARLRRPLAVAS